MNVAIECHHIHVTEPLPASRKPAFGESDTVRFAEEFLETESQFRITNLY